MKQDSHPEDLALHWTLSESELELLGTKTGATRLSFAILLKAFQFDGRFPDRREDVAGGIVAHLASQTGVPQEAYSEEEWSERTQRYQRALIRQHCGFRVFRAQDESSFIAWISERARRRPIPQMEALKIAVTTISRAFQTGADSDDPALIKYLEPICMLCFSDFHRGQ